MNITIFIGPTEGFGKLIPQVEKYETFKNFIDKHDKELRTQIKVIISVLFLMQLKV